MFCVRCGAANADGSQFCVKCGAPMGTPAGPPRATAAPATPGQQAAPSYIPSNLPPSQTVGPVESSGKAIASLICGFLFLFFPAAIVAIVLGHLALSDIRKSAGRLTGHGMAIAGLVLGYMGVVFIPFVLIVAAIAIPNLLKSRIAANEAMAVEDLRMIESANVQYVATYENGYAPGLGALGGPSDATTSCDHAHLIDPDLTAGFKGGYQFTYGLEIPFGGPPLTLSSDAVKNGCITPGSSLGYSVRADPIVRGTTGQRSFYVDQNGTIRFEPNGPASPDSQPLQ